MGLTSAQALSLPPTEPWLHSSASGAPWAGWTQGRIPASLRPISSSAPPAPRVSVRPGPSLSLNPSPGPRPLPAQLAPAVASSAPPALWPLGSYQLVPPARRRRRAANRRLPHCGPSRAGGLGPPAAGPPGVDAWVQAEGAWSPARPPQSQPRPTLLAAPTSPCRHAPPPPSALPRRGSPSGHGPPCSCLRRARTHGRQLRESHLRHGLSGPHARRVLRSLVRPLSRGEGGREGRAGPRGEGAGTVGPTQRRARHHSSGPGCGRQISQRRGAELSRRERRSGCW